MKKKILSLLLALVLVLSLLPVTALAGNVPAGSGVPDFAVFIGDTELPVVLTEEEAYESPYDKGNFVTLYTVELPAGTASTGSVVIEFEGNILPYNYNDTKYVYGDFMDVLNVGVDSAEVPLDADNDKAFDYIQVQTPYAYDEALGYETNELLYAITFRYPLPFTAYDSYGYSKLTPVTVQEAGYTSPYGSDPVTLYTVTIPEYTAQVKLSFNGEKVLAYNYSEKGYVSGMDRYPDNDYLVGADTATVYVDAIPDGAQASDGKFDFIQVQTPYAYDEALGYLTNELLYAITFDDGSTSGGGESGGETKSVTEAELLDALASAYAAEGPGSDTNAPWVTADMIAYASLSGKEYELSAADKDNIKNNAIQTIFTTKKPGDAAKNIIALVALGYDPTKLTVSDGTQFSGEEKLDALAFDTSGAVTSDASDPYTLPFVIMAYRLLGDEAKLQKLLDKAVETKSVWFEGPYGFFDPDAITPFMDALAPEYGSDSKVKAVLDEAVELVKNAQGTDGSIDNWGPNAASTGLAIAGFTALGMDPHDIKKGESDKSLIDGLLTIAADYGGTSLGTSWDNEQGLRGLVAAAKGKGYITYAFDTTNLKPAADLSIPSVTFNIQPDDIGAKLIFKDSAGNEVKPVTAGVFSCLERGDYTYEITASGYETVKGSVKVTAYSREKIYVSLVRSPEDVPESKAIVITVKVLSHDSEKCGGKYTYLHNASAYESILKDADGNVADSYTVTMIKGEGTARDAIIATLVEYGIPFTEEYNGYFSKINGEAGMGHGSSNSGWMYLVNGTSPTVGAKDYVFNGDATMIWYYTDDYTNEYGSEDWSSGDTAGAAKTDTTDAASAEVEVKPEVIDGEAKAEVKSEDVAKAIEAAKDAEVVTVKVETTDADKVEAKLDADAVKAAADADMGLKVETENGAVKVDIKTMDALAESGKDVAVTVTSNSDGTTTIGVTAGGEDVDAKVKVELPAAESGKVLVIVDADGKETVVKKSAADGDKMYAELPAGSTVKVVDAEGKDFGDVKDNDWFAESVEFVTSHGLFQGTGEDSFDPDLTMNRAMLVTVLYRLEDAKSEGGSTFGDVDPAAWYADAAAWASETGIVTGTGAGFEPDAPVTREQIATMLYRYANVIGLDTSEKGNVSSFSDGTKTSDWAGDAMAWAVGVGLFQGDEAGALNPGGEATRAQVAALFERLVGLIVK